MEIKMLLAFCLTKMEKQNLCELVKLKRANENNNN